MSMFNDINQRSDFAAHQSSSGIEALDESPQVNYYLGRTFSQPSVMVKHSIFTR